MGKQNCAGDSHLWVQLLHRFWQLSKLSSEWILLDSVCTMATALNVSNSNELQNPFKKYFTFIVFFCHRCHTWKGKRETGILKLLRNIYRIFQLRKQICCPAIGRGKISLTLIHTVDAGEGTYSINIKMWYISLLICVLWNLWSDWTESTATWINAVSQKHGLPLPGKQNIVKPAYFGSTVLLQEYFLTWVYLFRWEGKGSRFFLTVKSKNVSSISLWDLLLT